MYFLEANSKYAPTHVEKVLTTPNDALIGKPTTVNAVPIVEKPLTTQTVFAPVDACVVIYCKHFYTSIVFHYIFP